jgi:hypothetical protein
MKISCSFLCRLALPGLMSLILLSPALMRADILTTFDVSGTALNVSGGTLDSCANGALCAFSGMFTVDVTTGTVESSGLDIRLPGLPSFDTLAGSGPLPGLGWRITASNPADEVFLDFTTPPHAGSLVGFTGGSIIGGAELLSNYRIAAGGSITPTPEPSSLVLLAGVLGLLVFSRRRFGKKSAIH